MHSCSLFMTSTPTKNNRKRAYTKQIVLCLPSTNKVIRFLNNLVSDLINIWYTYLRIVQKSMGTPPYSVVDESVVESLLIFAIKAVVISIMLNSNDV